MPLEKEEKSNTRWILLGRLLFDLLRPSDSYTTFLRRLSTVDATIMACFESLRKFMKIASPTMIVLHLDETNTMDENTLEQIDRVAAEMLLESDIFFLVMQTGVRTTMMRVRFSLALSYYPVVDVCNTVGGC